MAQIGNVKRGSVLEKHEVEAHRESQAASGINGDFNSLSRRPVARQGSATEKFDSEQLEKDMSKRASQVQAAGNGFAGESGSSNGLKAVPKIGANNSVFREVPRAKESSELARTRPAAQTGGNQPTGNRNEPHTIPVKVIANGEESDAGDRQSEHSEPVR